MLIVVAIINNRTKSFYCNRDSISYPFYSLQIVNDCNTLSSSFFILFLSYLDRISAWRKKLKIRQAKDIDHTRSSPFENNQIIFFTL